MQTRAVVSLLFAILSLHAQETIWEARPAKGFRYFHLAWAADGLGLTTLRIPGGSEGCDGIWSIPADGSEPRQLRALESGVYCNKVLSDGKRVLTCAELKEYTILLVETGEKVPLHPPSEPVFRCSPSPDGAWIAWAIGDGQQSSVVWIARPDGSEARSLCEGTFAMERPSWSPDGKRLAVAAQDGLYVGEAPDFALERAYAPEKPWRIMERDGSPRGLEWFPDSSELVVRMGKTWTVRALLDNAELELLTGGWSEAVPLRGREVLCAKESSLYRVPAEGGTRKIANLPHECVGLLVPPKADRAYALCARVTMGGGSASASGGIVEVDLTSGETRSLTDVPLVQAVLSPDGTPLCLGWWDSYRPSAVPFSLPLLLHPHHRGK